jgi:hypothetical protein
VVVHDESRLEAALQTTIQQQPSAVRLPFKFQISSGHQLTRIMLQPLPDSGRALDEEVFLAQLRRRSRLLNDGFQASKGQENS